MISNAASHRTCLHCSIYERLQPLSVSPCRNGGSSTCYLCLCVYYLRLLCRGPSLSVLPIPCWKLEARTQQQQHHKHLRDSLLLY